jgi:hypothetical protein
MAMVFSLGFFARLRMTEWVDQPLSHHDELSPLSFPSSDRNSQLFRNHSRDPRTLPKKVLLEILRAAANGSSPA